MARLLVAVFATATLVGGLSPAPAAASTGGDEAGFVSLLNDLRASKGLAPLSVDGRLTSVARRWAATMAGEGRIWHNPGLADQMPPEWVTIGENVGMGGTGSGNSVGTIHQAFVNSATHYKNLVEPGFNTVGIGVVHDAGGRIFVVQNFMRSGVAAEPQGAPPGTPPPGAARAATARAVEEQAPPPPPPPPPEPSPRLTNVFSALQALDTLG